MPRREPEPSPIKNITGGGGCGCGCLGLLFELVGALALIMIFVEAIDAVNVSTAWWGGIILCVVGGMVFLAGCAAWVASLFME